MNIFVDARSLQDAQPSGVALYTRNLVHALCSEFPENRFTLFVTGMKGIQHVQKEFEKYSCCEIRSVRVPNKLLHLSFVLFRMPRLERLVGTFDAYFFPNIIYTPALPARSVLTVHDLSYLQPDSYYSLRSRIWHRMVRAKSLLRNAGLLVAVSHATKTALLMETNRKKDDVRVVHSAPVGDSHSIDYATTKKHFCVIGNIEERKNISGCIVAFSMARSTLEEGTKLLLVGKRGYLKPETVRLIDNAKKEGFLEETGYVSSQKKDRILGSAFALVFPSLYEGFGFPGLEAEKLGIPVIASNRTSLPEILGDGPLYVDPHNTRAIAKAITEVTMMDRTTITYSNPLLTRTWADVAKEMMNIFKETHEQYENRD